MGRGPFYSPEEDADILECLKPVHERLEALADRWGRTPGAMRQRYLRLTRGGAVSRARAPSGRKRKRKTKRAARGDTE